MLEKERDMVEKVENGGVIGSDEVGKVEPFKQLMVVFHSRVPGLTISTASLR